MFALPAAVGVVLAMIQLAHPQPDGLIAGCLPILFVAFLGLALMTVLQLVYQAFHLREDVTPLSPGIVLLLGVAVYGRLLPYHPEYLLHTDWALPLRRMANLDQLVTWRQWVSLVGLANLATVASLRIARRPLAGQVDGLTAVASATSLPLSARPALVQPAPPPRSQLAAAKPEPVQAQAQAPAVADMPEAFRAHPPRFTFEDVLGYDSFKHELLGAADAWREQGKNGILLHGAPGGGKTLMAEALAGECGLPIIMVNIGKLASKWINETTQRLDELFMAAHSQAPCVLLIDEIDALLKDRESLTGSGYEEHDRIVAAFLAEASKLQHSGVLLIGATNLIKRLDAAAVREGRFDFKLEIPLPDAVARRALIQLELAEGACHTDEETLVRLVRRWSGFNVPRIRQVTERACAIAQQAQRSALTYEDFYRALRAVQGQRGGAPEGAKRLDEMFMDAAMISGLKELSVQLVNVDRVERLGGSLPKGLVFYGPPGTGKTATAMALAAESGWTFIEKNGRDLMGEGAVDALRREASDLRPAIVFIDEADDILDQRIGSAHKGATNELLSLVDGAGGMLVDVVWIAATNHLGSMDKAALRGGRFERKIAFGAPGEEPLRTMLAHWASSHPDFIEGETGPWAEMAAQVLHGQTIATVQSVLQLGVNHAVAEHMRAGTPRRLTRELLLAAAGEIFVG